MEDKETACNSYLEELEKKNPHFGLKCENITDGMSFGACITYDKFYGECYLYLNLFKWTISIGYFTV